MRQSQFCLLILLILGSVVCSVQSPTLEAQPSVTHNNIATGVAEARAIASTLTAEIPTETPKPLPTATPDNIATGVAEAHAIAATLTALASTATISQPIQAETMKLGPTITSSTSSERIFFTRGDVLYQMDLDGSNLRIITQGIGLIEYLAVDSIHKKLYLSSGDEAKIYLIDLLSAGNKEIFSDSPGRDGQGLAIDPSGTKMYLGRYYDGVYVMDMNDLGLWIHLVNSDALYPLHGQRGQLQLDPTNRHIYFRTAYNYDCDLCRYIWRVDFDGNTLIKIIPYHGGDALALDLTERKMYFSDVFESRMGEGSFSINRANLDGSGLETVLAIPAPFRYCRSIVLDVVNKKMYMSLINPDNGNRGRAIARSNMDGSDFEILYEITGVTEQEVAGGIVLYLP